MNLAEGITDEISREDARQAILHLQGALKEIPDGPQLIKNLELERFKNQRQVEKACFSRLAKRREDRIEQGTEPELTFAEKVISNLLKVRDQMGYELGEAQQHCADDAYDDFENPLTRNKPTKEEFEAFVDNVFEKLPNLEWDEDEIADAMFAGISHTSELTKEFVKQWK